MKLLSEIATSSIQYKTSIYSFLDSTWQLMAIAMTKQGALPSGPARATARWIQQAKQCLTDTIGNLVYMKKDIGSLHQITSLYRKHSRGFLTSRNWENCKYMLVRVLIDRVWLKTAWRQKCPGYEAGERKVAANGNISWCIRWLYLRIQQWRSGKHDEDCPSMTSKFEVRCPHMHNWKHCD